MRRSVRHRGIGEEPHDRPYLSPFAVQIRVDRNAAQPPDFRSFSSELVDMAERANKHFLGQVFGVVMIAREVHGEIVD